MRSTFLRRGTLLGGVLLLTLLWVGCSDEPPSPVETPVRPDSVLDEPYFKVIFGLLSDIHDKLSDPTLRTETRLHLIAGHDEWVWQRLGYTREELGAIQVRLEMLRPGLEKRWPELLEASPPPGLLDPRAELIELLASDRIWPEVDMEAMKTVDIWCAIQTFYMEMQACLYSNGGHLYGLIGCYVVAYSHFLFMLMEGC